MTPPEEMRTRLQAAGLGRLAEGLAALARPAIRLVPSAGEAGSRIGGAPDLPPGLAWPEFRGQPQSFVAQVRCEEVAHLDPSGALPGAGLLSFFYDAEQSIWGFDPADRGGWEVLFFPEGAPLEPREPPRGIGGTGAFASTALVGIAEVSYPPYDSPDLDRLRLSRDERFLYGDARGDAGETVHRLLGYPDQIQGDMQIECQLASHGLYCGDSSGFEDPRARVLAAGATEWRLLLQVDSDEAAGTMWGDAGRIFYWIRDRDLRERRFDGTWLILQCS